jgi:Phage-related lysozyme (muraminidase)
MKLSSNGRALIQGFEGFSSKAYRDAAGWSIGYGHYLGEGDHSGKTITREEADSLFERDAVKYETAVSLTTPNTTQSQFDAMVSLAYNIGIGTGGFAGSTVARLHNMGDYQGAADAFRMWNKSQGVVHQGLVARREKERGVYLNGYGSSTHYPVPAPTQSIPGWPETEPPTLPSTRAPSSGALPMAMLLSLLGGAGYALWALLRR